MRYILPLVLSMSISSFVNSESWSLIDKTKGWNARNLVELYFHNSYLQMQWGWEALARYKFNGNERVLDFGCGDGKLSVFMSFMVPGGSVTGVDLSSEMITYAKNMFPPEHYKNLNFVSTNDVDLTHNDFLGRYDLVTSFCVFHLVPNPVQVLENLHSHMRKGGRIIITYPVGGGNSAFKEATFKAMSKRGWSYPKASDEIKKFSNSSVARQMIELAGFDVEYLEIATKKNAFASRKEFIDWFEGALAANWGVPPEGRRDFFEDIADYYLELSPDDVKENGFYYFGHKRIDIMAVCR